MLHFLQPIWLLASAGILIPVAIHLWNVKQGKTLKIGSVQLLTRTSQEQSTSLRLTELFLLLLRCLLIILLSLLLAKPYWQKNSQKGWVLMERNDIAEAYSHYKPVVDSLLKEGYVFHLFEKRFEEKDFNTLLKEDHIKDTADQVSYWKLIKQLDKELVADIPVYVFTANRLTRFNGERPELTRPIRWKTFTKKNSENLFIANAYLSMQDSVLLTMGKSDTSGTVYHQLSMGIDNPKQKDFSLNVVDGKLSVVFQNNPPVTVDTATLTITVFSDHYFGDAQYLQAAVQSLQQMKKRKITMVTAKNPATLPANQEWLFWVSDQPIPAHVNASNIFIYQNGKPMPIYSKIQVNELETTNQSELYKRLAYKESNGETIWRDGFGTPLLTKETDSSKQLFRFYSHFDPSWNDLVWNPAFPQMIYELIFNKKQTREYFANDLRKIDEAQLQLKTASAKTKPVAVSNMNTTDAGRIFWLLIFILFFIERLVSFNPKKVDNHA